jgi:hypothetical protein
MCVITPVAVIARLAAEPAMDQNSRVRRAQTLADFPATPSLVVL